MNESGAARRLKAALEPPMTKPVRRARHGAVRQRTERATIPALDVRRPGSSASRRGTDRRAFFGRTSYAGVASRSESIDAAMAPAEDGPRGAGHRQDPPDASVVFTSLVEPHKKERGDMLNRSKLAAVGLLPLCSWPGSCRWGGRESRVATGTAPGGASDAMVDYLAASWTSVRHSGIRCGRFRAFTSETDALWARVRPQFDSIKARMRVEIDAH